MLFFRVMEDRLVAFRDFGTFIYVRNASQLVAGRERIYFGTLERPVQTRYFSEADRRFTPQHSKPAR